MSQDEKGNSRRISGLIPLHEWTILNDTIMGGSSSACVTSNSEGLSMTGLLVEENGGFISCRSPVFSPPIDLSIYQGINIDIDGFGKTLKLAISCTERFPLINALSFDQRKWVFEFSTHQEGTTNVQIPFRLFKPSIRSRPLKGHIKFRTNSICQFQVLYSKFGMPGQPNNEFKPGPINFLVRSLYAYT